LPQKGETRRHKRGGIDMNSMNRDPGWTRNGGTCEHCGTGPLWEPDNPCEGCGVCPLCPCSCSPDTFASEEIASEEVTT
jgi:hypothetical protein